MDDSGPGDGRVMAARSRHRRFWSFVASGPGIRVIELHIRATQIQLLSINMGRHRPPVSSCWSPANAAHRQVDRTIIIERRRGFVNRYGQQDFIKNSPLLLLLLSKVLECLRGTTQRGVVASSMVARWKYRTSHRSVQRPAESGA
jgi:hypothetical protein